MQNAYASLTAGLNAWPVVKLTVSADGIVMVSPVDGLRPLRSARAPVEAISLTVSPRINGFSQAEVATRTVRLESPMHWQRQHYMGSCKICPPVKQHALTLAHVCGLPDSHHSVASDSGRLATLGRWHEGLTLQYDLRGIAQPLCHGVT